MEHTSVWKQSNWGRKNNTKLSQRVGILSKLSKVMPRSQFSKICEGLFTSKLINCLQLFGNVWGIRNMDEVQRRSYTFTKEDNRRLQVLQNQVLRLKTGLRKDTPTEILVKEAGNLSVNQLTAYLTIMTIFRAITSGKPHYIKSRLRMRQPGDGVFPRRHENTLLVTEPRLNQTRTGFLYRGISLFNALPAELRKEQKIAAFKRKVKSWIGENICVKPP